MQPSKEMLMAWAERDFEHNRRVAAIRFAKRENQTWSSDHPVSIRNQIKQLNALLLEAEAQE